MIYGPIVSDFRCKTNFHFILDVYFWTENSWVLDLYLPDGGSRNNPIGEKNGEAKAF